MACAVALLAVAIDLLATLRERRDYISSGQPREAGAFIERPRSGGKGHIQLYYESNAPRDGAAHQRRPVLLLNPACGSAFFWDPVMQQLVAAGYPVITFDLRDQGLSSDESFSSLFPYNLTLLKEDALSLLEHVLIGPEPVHVVCVGFGCTVAYLLAIEHPAWVRSLIVSGCESDHGEERSFVARVRLGLSAYLGKLRGAKATAAAMAKQSRADPAWCEMQLLRCHPLHRRRSSRTWLEFDVTSRLHMVMAPVRYLQPEHDALLNHNRARKERDLALLSNPAGIVTIENGTHNFPFEDPKRMSSELLAFYETLVYWETSAQRLDMHRRDAWDIHRE